MKTPALGCALMAVALLTATATAAVDISTTVGTTAPTSNVTLSLSTLNYTPNVSNTIGYGWKGDTRRDIGQTFTTTSAFTLDKISLQVQYVGSAAPGASYSLSLYQFANSSSLTSTATLGTWEGALPDATTLVPAAYNFSSGTVGPFLTFDIPDIALSSGVTYGFVLSFTSLSASETMNFWVKGGGYYSGGQQIETSVAGATTFTNSGGNDLLFYVQSVPEPSAHALISTGAMLAPALLLLRKKQP